MPPFFPVGMKDGPVNNPVAGPPHQSYLMQAEMPDWRDRVYLSFPEKGLPLLQHQPLLPL